MWSLNSFQICRKFTYSVKYFKAAIILFSFTGCFDMCEGMSPCTAFTQIAADCHLCRNDSQGGWPADDRVRHRLLVWTEYAGTLLIYYVLL